MKNPSRARRALALFATLAVAQPALAIDPFFMRIYVDQNTTVGTPDYQAGFTSLESAIDQIDFRELAKRTGYAGGNQTAVDFFFRGLPVLLAFPSGAPGSAGDLLVNTGNGQLTMTIPLVDFNHGANSITFSPNPNKTYTTVDQERADTIQQLKDYLKKNKDALKAILTALARYSPVDPLAGNPGSLFSKVQGADFNHGFTHKVSQVWGCSTSAFDFSNDAPIQVAAVGGVSDIFAEARARAAELQAENEIGMGLQFSNIKAPSSGGTFSTNSMDIPLSYTAKFDSNPGHKLRFDLPITVTDTGGAKTYAAGFGIAYTYPATDEWTLTPAVGVGATGSEDLGSAGGVGAYSLTSAYTMRLGSMAFSLGDAVGRYQSIGLKIGDVQAAADIKNTVFTNGLLMSGPSSLIASNMVMEYSITDTRITGTTVYSKYYDELGVALGHIGTEQGIITSYLKGGVSYVVGDHSIKAIKLNLSSRF